MSPYHLPEIGGIEPHQHGHDGAERWHASRPELSRCWLAWLLVLVGLPKVLQVTRVRATDRTTQGEILTFA